MQNIPLERDRDKDGVNDKKDKCPDVPGLKEFEGCPDTDEDGIPDPEDNCPEVAGPEENKGCPDTDGDTVLDKDDACPEVAGLVELNGCPDADEDGIADGDDECPEEAGPAATENGCPELTDEIMSTINQVGSSILFPANSAKIMGEKSLNAVAEIKRSCFCRWKCRLQPKTIP